MATNDLPCPVMDWTSSDRGRAIKDFKQLSQMWFAVKDIEAAKQHNYIILWLGTEGLRLFNTWGFTEEQLVDPNNIWRRLEQLEPTQNFRISRLEMQRLHQQEGEAIQDFVTRIRSLADKCSYAAPNIKNERILEQLIAGTRITTAQRELLNKDATLTLEQAIQIAKTHEASEHHMRKFRELTSGGNAAASIDALKHQTKACGNCGRNHPPRQCPAYGDICSLCKKPNHWRKMCRSGNHGTSTKAKKAWRKPRGLSRGRQRQSINAVTDNPSDDVTDLMENLVFDTIENKDNRDEVFVDLHIQYKKPATLRVKVDTGAQGNVLPLRIFRRMYPEKLDPHGYPTDGCLQEKCTTLYAYNGTTIKQHGTIHIPCRYDSSEWHQATFFVTESDGPAIMGLPSSRELKLVTLHCAIQSQKQGTVPIRNTDDLRQQYPDRFEGIGSFDGELHITLKEGSRPVIQPPRRYPVQLVDEIKAELRRMEEMDVITKETEPTDWLNALAFSRKASGALRVCLDPRALNECIKRTHHKTPTLEEITNRLNGSKFFSKLDAKHGYWSITLDEESSKLTTFNSPAGRYRFKRLPFGLNISQDAFQQHMDRILNQCEGTIGITDDIIVHGKDEEEHDRNLHHIMHIAKKSGLVFNPIKCHIKTPSIKFFGTIFDVEGAHPDPSKCAEIQAIPAPQSTTDLQRFLGIIQFLSPFIANLSTKTAPLRALLKNGTPFEWNSSLQKVFDELKSSICKDVTLAYFDVTKPATVQVDASQIGVGAALLQNGRPIAFASKALTETEQRYANIERELLAIVFGCERFHTYVFGKPFTVETDHKPLEKIHKKSLANTPPRLQRMMLRLQNYDITVKYRPGKEMVLADSLSRLNPSPGKEILLEKSIYAVQFTHDRLQQLKHETNKDPEITTLRDFITRGWPASAKGLPKGLREFWSCKEELTVEDDLVLKGERILIPPTMRRYILQQIHSGHQGIEKCKLRAKACVYWRGINNDIEELVGSCMICQRNRNSQQTETLMPHPIPDEPWQVLASDIFHFDNNDFILLADYHSKMTFVRRLPTRSTSSSVIGILKQLLGEHGVPQKLISDNGPQYNSMEFRKFANDWGFMHVTSSPHYPQSNGFAERMVQTVKKTMLKAKQGGNDLEMALLCLRTTPIDNNLPSPAQLLYGRQIQSNLPLIPNSSPRPPQQVQHAFQHRQAKQKAHYDKHACDLPPLQAQQRVLMQEEDGTWSPATVLEKRNEPRSYIVRSPNGGVYRRNRRHLRDISASPGTRHVTWSDQDVSEDCSNTHQLVEPRQLPPQDDIPVAHQHSAHAQQSVQANLRRSDRQTKRTKRFIEEI